MNKRLTWIIVTTLIINAIGIGIAPAPAAAAPAPASSAPATALPAWYTAAAAEKEARKPATASPHSALPAWFEASQPKSPQPAPVQRNQVFREISNSLLTVDVFGPASASIGAPPEEGEIYIAVIRNDSSDVAYGVSLTATHQSFMVYDDFSEIISSTGTITPVTFVSTATSLQWTPVTTYNLAAGETITLRFRLRAECNGVSGQRLEVGVNYNADPGEPSNETNVGGLNVTLGRGNLVINKYPALQTLGTGDFGKPITWTVEVQNTGLGKIYDAVITDTGGENLGQPTGELTPTDTITVLNINETRFYTVVGTVEACNFTNVAEGAWPCGNIEGDGYYTNPVTSTVSVLFNPNVPNVALDVSDPLTFSYCGTDIHTVTITATDLGGAAGDLRIASNLANHGFLEILPGTVGGDWTYDDASGRFSYQGGPPTGTLTAGEAVTLTFQVQPSTTVCSAGSGSLTFTPLYRDICANEPFTGAIRSLAYEYAQGEAPTLAVAKSGLSVVASGETFVYTVTLSGSNAQNISGTIYVTDVVPSEFALQGPITSSNGVTATIGQTVTWQLDPTTLSDPFSETLIYQVKAITETGGDCGAGEQVNNGVEAFAQPTCDACDVFTPTAQVDTIIVNQEGVIPTQNAVGSYEVCGEQGFIITNRYEITGSTVITWAGAVFTEALGTDIGAGALPTGTVPLEYRNALSVVIDGVDYTSHVTETETGGPLVLDLGGLDGIAPTQTFVLYITYTVGITEASLNGEVEQTFYDWTQLYLPNSRSNEVCADNSAFNQAFELTISRGDLLVGLSPPVLNRCETNRAVIQVTDRITGALTNQIVVTFTSSSEQIETARNFTYAGSLAGISPITVTSGTIGGGRSVITFTLPPGEDLDGDGTIEFDIDVGCYGEPPWRAGITFESRCGFPHRDAAALSHDYRAPSLILFATPIRYTLREREPTWKFFVTNNGNLTATHVVVTNTASGLTITTFVADGDDITATLPARTGVFTIGEIAPGQQRAVTVTAEAFSCTPLGVDIAARLDCFDDFICGYREERINFITPRPYLRTNNGQSADLPMCDLGRVVFTTKNASPDVNLYRINITETLQQLVPAPGEPFTVTILDSKNNPVATTNAFNPISKTVWGEGMNAVTTTLQWLAHLAPTEVATWFQELPPLYTVRITVPVRTSCVAPNAPTGRAAASAEETCGTRFSRSENAVTFQTKEPNLDVIKDGRVDEEDSEWGKTVYAAPGQTVTWRLEVINPSGSRAHVAENVVLSDTWPVYFDFITATTSYTYHIQEAARTITWEVGDVALDASLYFYITGTVVADPAACSAQTINQAKLLFGCDDGCTHDKTPMDSANLYSAPILNVALTPETFSICEGDIELTIRNDGARAYSSTLTVTMPSGYQVYTYTLGPNAPTPDQEPSFPSTAPEFYWDELPGRISADPYFFTMTLRVQNTGASGACPGIVPETVTATLGYDDHAECTDSEPYSDTNTAPLTVGEPNLVVSKDPSYQTIEVGKRVTWTLTVSNAGTAPATNVIVTDVVGTNYITVVAGNGTNGTGPFTTIAAGTLITWAPADIAVDGVWTAAVSAALDDTGDNRNVVTATAFCDTGCASATGADTAHTTLLLENFGKHPAVQTGTIGSLTVFTFAATLQDRDALYEDLTITDTLPVGLGYVSSVLTYTYDADNPPGVTVVTDTPSVPTGTYPSGPVVWALGDLSGTVEIAGVVTAVIQAVDTNQDGVRLVNDLRMTYVDDSVFYVYTDTADVDVLEPILHIGKTYVTPRGCEATLLEDNFNDEDASGWDALVTLGTWGISDGIYSYSQITDSSNRRAFTGEQDWTDYSFSFMMRTSDPTGSMGGYVRQTSDHPYTTDRGYLFRWAHSQMRLQRRDTFALLDSNPADYETNRWYHVEMRVTGDLIEVFVDGTRYLSATDTMHPAGRVGLLSSSHTETEFDDVLVTRLDDMACTVGANDLVTYTLTISNQGRFTGHDLVVTDTLPGGMSLVTYTFESDDPATVTDTQPSPIPGATGVLTWGFNQLAPADPFSPTDHTAITMTLVLSVADWITANTVLPNQAALSYDGWISSTQPTTITRDYSGGSHSTAVRTVDGDIAKTVQFSPPPTATLGSLVTYTLIVPATPISATLYDVVVTDTVDARLRVQSVISSADPRVTITNTSGLTNNLRFELSSIPHSTQAYITVTARISHTWPDGDDDANAGDVITNAAVMTHSTATEITTTNEVSTTVGEPALEIVKASDPPTSHTVGAGDAVAYTVRITNASGITASAAYDVVFTDTLPEGMRAATPSPITITLDSTPVSSSEYVTGYRPATGVLTAAFTPAFSIPVGGVLLLEYVAKVDDGVGAGLDLTNTAQVAWSSLPGATPGDRDYGPEEDDTTVHTVLPGVDKAVVPATATIGSLVTYTIRVPDPAITATLYNVTVTDELSPWLAIVNVEAPGADGSLTDTHAFTVTYANIPRNEQRLITVTAIIIDVGGDPVAGDLITNVVTLAHSTGVTTSDEVTVTVAEPDVGLRKAVQTPRDPVGAGDLVTYTLTLSNTGDWPAYDLVVTDSLPLGLDFVSDLSATVTDPTTATTGGAYPVYTASQLNVDGYWIISFTARVQDDITASVTLTNAAWGVYDGQPGENDDEREDDIPTDTVPVDVGYPALELAKSADPDPVDAGGLLTYTLTVVNTGIVSATGVLITDTIPVNTTFVAATTPHSGPDPDDSAGSIVTWTLGTLDIGAPRTVTMTVQVDDPLPDGTILTNTAWVTSTEGITDTDTVTTEVESAHTLAITKTAEPSPVQAGDLLTYTLEWAVSGNETALDVMISDTVPLSTTYQDCGPLPCDIDTGGVITWTLGDQLPGANGSVTFTVRVDSPLISGTVIHNAAFISDTQGVTDTDDITTPVESAHTLAITKTADPSPVQAGDLLTYTLEWAVSANEPALDVTISDTVPANTRFVTATLPHARTGDLVRWSLGDQNPGATGVVTLVVLVDTPLLTGTQIHNAAFISDTQGITDTDDVDTPVESAHTLALTKTADPPVVQAGDLLTYTLEWSVSGNEPALDVTISDTVPVSTTFDSCAPAADCSHSSGRVIWALGDVNPPASGVVTLTVRVDSPLISGTVIHNAAVITDGQNITDTDEIDTPVESAHTLSVRKTVTPSVVAPDGLITYTIAYTIAGNEPAYDVTLSDTVPAHTTFYTATPLADSDPVVGGTGPVIWRLGDFLTATTGITEQTGVVTLVVRADIPLPDGLEIANTVVITDAAGESDDDAITNTVGSDHTLSLVKTADPSPVQAGDRLTYTLAYTVSGDGVAHDVTISDTVPAYTTFDSCVGCDRDGDLLTWSLGDLSPLYTGSVTFTVRVTYPLDNDTVLHNAALITDTELTDTDEITTPVESAHTLSVRKTVTPSIVAPDGLITYTIAYTIAGNEPAYDVTLSDTVPAHTTFYTATPLADSDPGVGGTGLVVWRLGDFLPATSGVTEATGVVTLVVRADIPLLDGLEIVNTVVITDDADESDDDAITTTVESAHAITLSKRAAPDPVQAGELLTYTLAYTVTGDGVAPDVTISDTVPVSTTFDSCNGCIDSGDLLIWRLGDISPFHTGSVTFTVRVDSPLISGTVIHNAAVITDGQNITDTDEIDTPVESAHTLSVRKTVTPSVVAPDGLITYTIAYTIAGNEPAYDVTLSDTVPAHTTFYTATPTPASAPAVNGTGLVVWNLGDFLTATTGITEQTGVVTLVVRADIPLPDGLIIANTVVITDAAGESDDDAITNTVGSDHTLSLVKTADPSPVQAGDRLTYTLAYTVSGDGVAHDVTISDTVPAYTTFDSCVGCDRDGDLLTWSLGDLSPLYTGSVTFTVRVTYPLANDTVLHNAALITDTELTDSDEITTPVESAHTLSVRKTVTPSIVAPDGLITYTIAYTIAGNEPAYDVTLSDTVPAHTTFYTATPPADSDPGVGNTGLVIWDLGDFLTATTGITEQTGVVTLVVRADIPLLDGLEIVNTVVITDDADESDDDAITTTVESAHAITLSKRAAPDPVQAGDLLTYTLAYTITGDGVAPDVTISDTVPASTTFDSCNGCIDSGDLLIWRLGDISPFHTGSVTFTVRVDSPLISGTVIHNAAVITDGQNITDTDEIDTPVESAHTLALTKTAAPDPATAGGLLTYTLAWSVSGNEPAFGVTLSDTIPAHTTFYTATPPDDSGLGEGDTGVVIWALGDVNPPAAGSVRLVVRVDSDAPSGTLLTNAALISDTQNVTDTDEIDTPVETAVEIWVEKTGSASPVTPGEPMTYSLTVHNDGPSDAEDVLVTDTLPAEVAFAGAAPYPNVSNVNPLVWDLGTLTPGERRDILITVTVNADVIAGFTNTVIITTSTPGDDPGNNEDDYPVDVEPEVEIWVKKTGSASPVTPGEPMTYSLTVHNDGPSDAENVLVTDTLPIEVTFGDAIPYPNVSNVNPLVWDLGTLAAGVSETILITVTVNADVIAGFTNTVVITTSTPGDDPGDNEDDYPVDVEPEVEIWVEKTGSASPVTPGEPMTYSLTITNDGPSDAENVVVTDTLPAEVSFGSASPAQDSGPNPLVWNLGTLAAGASQEIIITVTVNADVIAGFTNTVVITTSTPGDDPGDNEDDYPVDVEPEVEIWVEKTGSASPVTPGEPMTYSLTITNDGPSDAENVVVTDTLPAEVTFDDADPYPDVSAVNPLVWNLGTLTPGERRDILITVTVNADVTAGFTNTVIITTSTPGDDPGNNEDDHPADATPRADLGIVKTDDPDPVTLGALLTYTLRVTNYGPGAAENVRVTDTLPAEAAYVGAQPAHTYTPPDTVVWALGALSPGETRDLTLTVRVHTWATQTFTNVATLGSDTPDDDPDNDEDDEPTTPLAPGIDVIKTVTPTVAVPNAPFTYTIRVANVGQVALDPLALTDTLPPDFNYVAGSGIPVDPDVVAEPLLVWLDLGRLAPGDSLTVSFAVTATPGITGTYVNLVTATGDTPGGPITDTDDAPITIDEPALNLDKRLVGWDRERDVLTFTIAISNVGPVALDVIPLMDDYDYRFLAFKHATPAPDEVVPNPGLLRWHDLTESPGGFGQNLPPGVQFEVTTVFSVVADITQTVNTAAVTGARDIDDNPANDDEDDEIVINIPTAIALRYLRAARREDGILLEWAMLMERDVYAFELHRATQDQFDQARQIGFQASQGSGAEYAYLDEDVGPEPRYWYWVTALDNEAGRTRYGPVSVTGGMDAQWERVYLPLVFRRSQ